jgi:hypothetical protein
MRRAGGLLAAGSAAWRSVQDMTEQPAEEFHRNRREHGGAPDRIDDDRLARLTEEERVEAGLDDYDPDEVPPATDSPPQPWDVTETDEYQDARAEIRHEYDQYELADRG